MSVAAAAELTPPNFHINFEDSTKHGPQDTRRKALYDTEGCSSLLWLNSSHNADVLGGGGASCHGTAEVTGMQTALLAN